MTTRAEQAAAPGAGLTVRDILWPQVVSVAPDDTVRDLVAVLAREGISGVPVLERGGRIAGVELRVLHLARPARAVVGPEMSPAVEAALARAGGCADVEVREEVMWGGPPTREIVRLAAEDGTDLLVLGTHGRGAPGRVLAGSVGSGVARAAPCPVLLVPPRMWRRRPGRAASETALAAEAAGR